MTAATFRRTRDMIGCMAIEFREDECDARAEVAGMTRVPGLPGVYRCDRPGLATEIGPLVPGRRVEPIAYCEEHGGRERADRQAGHDWMRQCPLPLAATPADDEGRVLDAGTMALRSEHAYVMLRPLGDGRWLAWLGIGSHMWPVYPPGAAARREAIMRAYRGRRANAKRRAREEGAKATFETAAEAERVARAAWRSGLAERVRAIRRARGGTLAWGMPVEPRGEPVILGLGE